jgi:hypothetical protein
VIVEADEAYHLESQKGSRNMTGKLRKREPISKRRRVRRSGFAHREPLLINYLGSQRRRMRNG